MFTMQDVARDLRPMVERIGARYGRKPQVHSFPFDEVFVYVFDKRVVLATREELNYEAENIARLAEARLVDAFEKWRPRFETAAQSACK